MVIKFDPKLKYICPECKKAANDFSIYLKSKDWINVMFNEKGIIYYSDILQIKVGTSILSYQFPKSQFDICIQHCESVYPIGKMIRRKGKVK